MEELPVKEQIFYIHNCKEAAALSGTLTHNMLFAGVKASLIILNKTHMVNEHQVMINQMMELQVVYIDVYREPYRHFPESYGTGPFLLDSRSLQDYFKERGFTYYKESGLRRLLDMSGYSLMCLKLKVRRTFSKIYSAVERYIPVVKYMKLLCGISRV